MGVSSIKVSLGKPHWTANLCCPGGHVKRGKDDLSREKAYFDAQILFPRGTLFDFFKVNRNNKNTEQLWCFVKEKFADELSQSMKTAQSNLIRWLDK
mgnify:CR=1 FL=1